MSLQVRNRCLYGSRIYSTAHAESDFDYLYIIEDDSMAEAWALCKAGEGTLTFANNHPDLSPQPFSDAFFRQRDFLLFFDAPALKQSACVLSVSHYEALIRANVLWVLEILFSDDRFKLLPEGFLPTWACHLDYLKGNLKFEIQHAISKGISFLKQGEDYKAYKNFYFAHRFVTFAKQILAHGSIVDHEEPVELFYLQELTKTEAVESVRKYRESIPGLAGALSQEGMPVRVAPSWVDVQTFYVKAFEKSAVFLSKLPSEEIVVNRNTVATPGGALTRAALLDAKVSMTYFSVLQMFGETMYVADIVPPTPANEVVRCPDK